MMARLRILECDECPRPILFDDGAHHIWDPRSQSWKVVCDVCYSLMPWAEQTRFLEPEKRPTIG